MVQPWTGAPHSWVRFNPWSPSPSLWHCTSCFFLLFVCSLSVRVISLHFPLRLYWPPPSLCFICLCLSCNQLWEWRPSNAQDLHLETLLHPSPIFSAAWLSLTLTNPASHLPPPDCWVPASYPFPTPLSTMHLFGTIQKNLDRSIKSST